MPDDGAQCSRSSEGKGERGEEVAAVIAPLLSRVKLRRLALSVRLGTARAAEESSRLGLGLVPVRTWTHGDVTRRN